MTGNLFLTTHASEVGTVLLVEYIWTQKICSYYKSHFLQKKKKKEIDQRCNFSFTYNLGIAIS